MTPVAKGQEWGRRGGLPRDGVVAASDAEVRAVLEGARRERRDPPVVGIVGGDLCRTLGGGGDCDRLTSSDAMTFEIDVGEALVDGRVHLFVAHLVARTPLWGRAFVAMNAQWYGSWIVGP